MALWIVATPIGTLQDLSPRAREVLRSAQLIAAEDTRVTRRLLSALDIPSPPMVSVHAHNEHKREDVARRALDEDIALVCDAGTPGLSDPGSQVVSFAHQMGVVVRSVPGPSAWTAALAVSGLPCSPCSFLGFPPRKGRDNWARALLRRAETIAVYEAPKRILDLVHRLAELDGGREAVLCRELSKVHEEVLRAPLSELEAALSQRDQLRGECVLLIGPGTPLRDKRSSLDSGSLKDISAALGRRWCVPRKEAYRRLLDLEADYES
ncbi:MAG: 16S rRNA (cytidine(1402)-2'-O)-methyltransferase [Proteobacteria bacterium]|nr:16S rRNA (cytidine(1402)-2'-O)-methyltransferase [Pseudomonadota bacterium]